MDKEPLLRISHLQKHFGKFQALKDINFEINAGEVFGFIGPNGAGKSTTIRVLLGILKASGGQATILVAMSGRIVWRFISELLMCQAMFIYGLI